MSYQIKTTTNTTEALEAVVTLLQKQYVHAEAPVILVPTPTEVARIRDLLVARECAFAVRVETLSAWIEDRWELFGDGRRLVSPLERTLFMSQAIKDIGKSDAQRDGGPLTASGGEASGCAQESLAPTPGVVKLASSLAREALPFIIDAAREKHSALSAGERNLVAVLSCYAQELHREGLCEMSEAAQALSAAIGLNAEPGLVVVGFEEFSCAFDFLLRELSECTSVTILKTMDCAADGNAARSGELKALLNRIFSFEQSQVIQPSGAVRFLLPAGRYAMPRLVANEVLRAVQQEQKAAEEQKRVRRPLYVVSREPATLFSQISEYLASKKVSSAVSARTTFAQTDFGRALLALVGFSCDKQYSIEQAVDFALSSFSGITLRDVYTLDARWREDRTIDRGRIAQDLSKMSEFAQSSFALLATGDLEGLLIAFETRLRRQSHLSESYRSEQMASLSAARRFVQACATQGVSAIENLKFLQEVNIAANAQIRLGEASEADVEPAVICMDLASVAERPSCSCSTLLLCDLLESAYPVRPVETGATLLLEKLNLCPPADALAAARKQFFRALSTACDAVVCERPLNTSDADEAYPAVVFEELIDCYRVDPTCLDDLDKATGLPCVLLDYVTTAGEDSLHANLALAGELANVDVWEVAALGVVSPSHRSRVVLPRKQGDDLAGGNRPLLSPSALESYLECPQKWFALRRLRLRELDAGFGPLEMGSFSHGVLKSFYEHFNEEGYSKVSAANIERARELMRETFEYQRNFQLKLECGSNRLIPRNPIEQTEVNDLEKKLVGYLDYEGELLPDFTPTYFEFEFGRDEPFEYANCYLRGSIDRIDVNGQGQAVVIDYKGSVSPDYDLAQASPAGQAGEGVVPHKIQALVYAQVARRLLGLEVVGALYVSYGRTAKVSGAYDRRVLDEGVLLGASAKKCGVPGPAGEALGLVSFGEVVDATEASVEKAIESLRAGLVIPDPRGKNPCGFCPVLACPKRRDV